MLNICFISNKYGELLTLITVVAHRFILALKEKIPSLIPCRIIGNELFETGYGLGVLESDPD